MSELDKYFEYKCIRGLESRGLHEKSEYIERLNFEIKTILKMGFPGYFLIVQDVVNWAKRNDIYVGPGRGSAAGSLVSYSLGITNLDPIKWCLLFERFLNPSRVSMPDIDLDIEKRYRDKVINYVVERYGQDRVAHIGTFNFMRAKAAVRAVTRTLGHPYILGDNLAKALLLPVSGKHQKLSVSFEKVTELGAHYKSQTTEGEILRWAEKIEDSISSIGVHASGLIIANESLLGKVPLFRSKDGELTTQWEMNNIEEIGLIKFDFLGLDALTKIHNCISIIKNRHNVDINIDEIDLEDNEVFAKLRTGDNLGIFQLEASSGIRDLLVEIRPTSVEDLVALVAIYRPGPLESDYKEIYLDVRAGKRDPEYLVPELEPILKRTEGWCIYQEQVMEIARELCGYSMSEADDLRKAIGKKIPEKMAKHEPKFKQGWKDSGLDESAANILWTQLVAFASYAFNRSHAAAYAYITYQTAWLKTHYPVEYMCALLISEAGNQDQMIKVLAECRRMNIEILPPDINDSKETFYIIEERKIRFGLGPIKNLGKSVKAILSERTNGSFETLKSFCERVDLGIVNRLKLESLIKAGAFDRFGITRATMIGAIELIWEYRKQIKSQIKKMETYQKKLDARIQRATDIDNNVLSNTGKPLRLLKLPVEPEAPIYPDFPLLDEMNNRDIQTAEHELLGFYVSSHPLDIFAKSSMSASYSTLEDIKGMPTKTKVSIAAVITNRNEITTKKTKEKMSFLTLEDLTGSIESVIFPWVFKRVHKDIEEAVPMKIDGLIEVTEADEGRVTKLIITSLTQLNMEPTRPEKIEATINILKAKQLSKLLKKYKGNHHEVMVVYKLDDGTIIRLKDNLQIGNYKGAFLRELVGIINE